MESKINSIWSLCYFFFFKTLIPTKKGPATETLQHSFKTMDKEKFKSELNSLDWPNVLHINNNSVDLSFDLFLENVNKFILKHAPLKKLLQERNYVWNLG